jgi:hypothetical protein
VSYELLNGGFNAAMYERYRARTLKVRAQSAPRRILNPHASSACAKCNPRPVKPQPQWALLRTNKPTPLYAFWG